MIALLIVLSVPAQSPSYAREVRPFFTRYCLECHTAREPEGGLVLETFASLSEGGKRGPAIVPGKPDEGTLIRMIESKLKPVMPPKKSRQPSAAEIARVRAWVAAGAKDDGSIRNALPKITPRKMLPPPILAVVRHGKHILAGGRGEVLALTPTGDVFERHKIDRDRITTALVSLGEIWAVAGSTVGEGHDVRLYPGGKVVLRHEDTIQALAISPDGRWLASASYDRLIRLWDLKTGKPGPVLKDHSDAVYGIAFSPDGKLLASAGADRAIKIWEVESGTRLYTLSEATDWVYAVAWSPSGGRLAGAGVDTSIRIWDVNREGGKVALSAFAHEGPVVRLVYSRDGKTLVSLGEDRVVKVWEPATLTERKVHPAQTETCHSLTLSEDEKIVYVGRNDGVLSAVELLTGKAAGQLLPVKPLSERLPEKKEDEPNDSARTGQRIDPSVTLIGSIHRPGDVDWYRFEAREGEEIGVRVTVGDKAQLDPLLRLVDADGNTLTEGRGDSLGHVVKTAGTYSLGIWDRTYRGGDKATYRLQVGPIPVITSVFPLGVPPNAVTAVRVEGVNLGRERTTKVSLGADAIPGRVVPLELGGAKSSVVVGEFPEVRAGESIPTPGTANGQIARPGAQETWSFEAKKGRRVILEVMAGRLGSPLDSTIEILDDKGRPLPRAVLRSQARTYTVFRDNDSRTTGIRIEAWGELAVNDLILLGNELMKIRALPRNPDDDCRFWDVEGRRVGFLGTTPTHHSVGSPLYKVSVHPPGSTFPPNGLPLVTLFWRNDDGGRSMDRDSRLVFDPPADGTYRVRVADTRGEGGASYNYRLTVREPRPDFSVALAPASPTIFPGVATPMQINVTRLDDFDGTIDVELKNLPPGLSAPKTNIPSEDTSTSVAIFADSTVKLDPRAKPIEVIAQATIGGKVVQRMAKGGVAVLGKSADILTTTESAEVTLHPGGEGKVTVTIERRNGFAGRVPLDVRGLPHGVRVLDVGLNGILIIPGETKRTFVLYAEPWVKAMDHPIVVFARREGKPEEYAARSVLLRVK